MAGVMLRCNSIRAMLRAKHLYTGVFALCIALFAGTQEARAQLNVTIDQGSAAAIKVALPFFAGSGASAVSVGREIISVAETDLQNSGYFRSANRQAFAQRFRSHSDLPAFDSWRLLNVAAVLAGDISANGSSVTVTYRLWDPYSEKQLLGKQFTTDARNARRLGHILADQIYEALTGEKGYFDSRIAYIAESFDGRKRVKRVAVMDQDGANHRFLTQGEDLALTPRFAPEGDKLIYLAYRGSSRSLNLLSLSSLNSSPLSLPGDTAFSPAFAPDGRRIAVTISTGGNSDIYAAGISGGAAGRLTSGTSIDTSPSYSPDGQFIVFSSDRSGKPQLYVMRANGGGAERISFGEGDYNAPAWSPAGDLIAFTKRDGGRFHIGVMRPDGAEEKILTTGYMDEGPAWSPNGRVIAFTRSSPSAGGRPGQSSLYRVDILGRHLKRLPTPGQGSDPSWAPAF